MTAAILALFTQFNPVIAGILLGAGSYYMLRSRVAPPLRGRSGPLAGRARRR